MKEENTFFLAVDVGGTKTEAVLFRRDGSICERYYGRGVNPLVSGITEAEEAYCEVIDRLTAKADGKIRSIYIGIPALQYFGTKIIDDLKNRYSNTMLTAEPDAVMMISANIGHRDGACLVCGTGSGLYVRKNDIVREYGGWGWLIGGCGSGYLLGLSAIQACTEERDGVGPKTILTELCEKRFGDDILNHLPELYAGGRPLFASFVSELFAAAQMGDAAARKKIKKGATDLADLINAAHREIGPYTLILNGGVFRHFPSYVEIVRELAVPSVEFVLSEYPPIWGAASEALVLAGEPVNDAIRDRFLSEYQLLNDREE